MILSVAIAIFSSVVQLYEPLSTRLHYQYCILHSSEQSNCYCFETTPIWYLQYNEFIMNSAVSGLLPIDRQNHRCLELCLKAEDENEFVNRCTMDSLTIQHLMIRHEGTYETELMNISISIRSYDTSKQKYNSVKKLE